MKKLFNVTGLCVPNLHYMADISSKIHKIEEMVDSGYYFTINRPRQYGKTTTLNELAQKLRTRYIVIKTSFEGVSDIMFSSEESFCSQLFNVFADSIEFIDAGTAAVLRKYQRDINSYNALSKAITDLVKEINTDVVLIIDEVDKSSNSRIFLKFLGLLRNKYLARSSGEDITFKSVILSGIHDIKNLKLALRDEKDARFNSPWNIAEEFRIDMSFSAMEIDAMLIDYIKNTGIEFDSALIAEEIYKLTGGYPFLVSKICKTIDEQLGKNWTEAGMLDAINTLVDEKNTLFDDIIKNLENAKELYNVVYNVAVLGQKMDTNTYADELGLMYGILDKGKDRKLKIHNKVFEILIYDYMIAKREREHGQLLSYKYRTEFVDKYGDLIMDIVLSKFQELMKAEYRDRDAKFIEREGRLLFLAFVKPIINGIGFYFVESQTRQDNRMDVVITYNRKKYIIELKIWHGELYEGKGLNQLAEYLDSQNQSKGYMVIFNFNRYKEYSQQWLKIGGKDIFEVMV